MILDLAYPFAKLVLPAQHNEVGLSAYIFDYFRSILMRRSLRKRVRQILQSQTHIRNLGSKVSDQYLKKRIEDAELMNWNIFFIRKLPNYPLHIFRHLRFNLLRFLFLLGSFLSFFESLLFLLFLLFCLVV